MTAPWKLPRDDLDIVAAKAGTYQAEGNLQEAATLLTGINVQSPIQPFITKMTQLRLERNHAEAVRLLQARQAQFQFASQIDQGTNQVILAFAQRLAGDTAAAKATAEQARNTLKPLCRDQPDNSFFAQQLALANAALGEKETAISEGERATTLLPTADDPLSGPTREEVLGADSGDDRPQRPLDLNSEPAVTNTVHQLALRPHASYGGSFSDSIRSGILCVADPAFQKLCEEKQK